MVEDLAPRAYVHCCACSRNFPLADSAAPGDVVSCPFCFQLQRLREMTVLVSDPVERA
jgi:hypothetical protein